MSIAKVAIASLLSIYFCFALMDRLDSQLTEVIIEVQAPNDDKYLISKKDVKKILKSKLGYDISLEKLGDMDLYDLENWLEADSRINTANLFVTKSNKLHIKIEQRKPIVRVDVSGGKDYYLDYKGGRIPITESVRVPVATGAIDKYIPNYKNKPNNNLNGILQVAKGIHDDAFLASLIEQIHIDSKGQLTFVPKVGQLKILFGEAEDLEIKFYRIKLYYKEEVKKIGINKFKELDVRFAGQVVGRGDSTS